jgi:small multidrug resistance family-3 protein
LGFLVLAAALEIGGDAAIRYGLTSSMRVMLVLGVALLAVYGFAVNANRSIDFGRLMGVYIAVFCVVSQVISFAAFGERPTPSIWVGVALIVAGGAIMLLGAR